MTRTQSPLLAVTLVVRIRSDEHKGCTMERKEHLPAMASLVVPSPKTPGTNESPEPMSLNGTGLSQRSLQPSPTNSAHGATPVRKLDQDYDGDTAETHVNVHSYPLEHRYGPSSSGLICSRPTNHVSAGSPHTRYAMGHSSTPSGECSLNPGPNELEMNKYTRMGMSSRRLHLPAPGQHLSVLLPSFSVNNRPPTPLPRTIKRTTETTLLAR